MQSIWHLAHQVPLVEPYGSVSLVTAIGLISSVLSNLSAGSAQVVAYCLLLC